MSFWSEQSRCSSPSRNTDAGVQAQRSRVILTWKWFVLWREVYRVDQYKATVSGWNQLCRSVCFNSDYSAFVELEWVHVIHSDVSSFPPPDTETVFPLYCCITLILMYTFTSIRSDIQQQTLLSQFCKKSTAWIKCFAANVSKIFHIYWNVYNFLVRPSAPRRWELWGSTAPVTVRPSGRWWRRLRSANMPNTPAPSAARWDAQSYMLHICAIFPLCD